FCTALKREVHEGVADGEQGKRGPGDDQRAEARLPQEAERGAQRDGLANARAGAVLDEERQDAETENGGAETREKDSIVPAGDDREESEGEDRSEQRAGGVERAMEPEGLAQARPRRAGRGQGGARNGPGGLFAAGGEPRGP